MLWQGPYRWVSTMLLVIVGFTALDTLFRALGANPESAIVGMVGAVAGLFLAPFGDMFPEQAYLLTALIALLGYALLAAIVVSATETIEAARRDRDAARARRAAGLGSPPRPGHVPPPEPAQEPTQPR